MFESHQSPEESDEEEEGLSTEQQAQVVLQNLLRARDIQVELRPCDSTEEQLVTLFALVGCGCNRKCSAQFSADYVRDIRVMSSVMVSLTWLS